MLRWTQFILVAGIILLVSPAAVAGEVRISGGGFQFLHAPVNPQAEIGTPGGPTGYCLFPPGLQFSVQSDTFFGSLATKQGALEFSGSGEASGCAYLEPIFGVAATFSGSFTWSTAAGDLKGTFELLDFVTDNPAVFDAVIFIKFKGGTGKFSSAKGGAIATGVDLPFGGLGEDFSTAGVIAENITGKIQF